MKISKKRDKGKEFIFLTLISYILFFLFITLYFRQLRDVLPSPEIDQSSVVGYSQYFGYPFFIDTVLFFAMVFIPLILFFVLITVDIIYKKEK